MLAPFPLLFFSFISRTGDLIFYFLRFLLQGSVSNSQVLKDGRETEAIIIFLSGSQIVKGKPGPVYGSHLDILINGDNACVQFINKYTYLGVYT